MTEWKTESDNSPKGSYTDKDGNVYELSIICDHPSLTFTFDGPRFEHERFILDSVETNGCTFDNAPMSFYQEIIDFCQQRIDKIPHYEINNGVLEWVDSRDKEEEKHED